MINSLDPSQKQALEAVLSPSNDEDVYLIFGPPGTGKSQLLVSLLFELAKNGRNVLFVSQNTEALRVIERMIVDIDKEMDIGDNHLSLRDFCLRLYTKEHRYLKYIRAQSSRLTGKTISYPKDESEFPSIDHGYKINYSYLERVKNYNIQEEEVGVDELLRYFLQYVKTDLVVETLYDFNNINLRNVFKLLESYTLEKEFNYYNVPQNELRFISPLNSVVTLNDLQSGVQKILVYINKLKDTPPAKIQQSILDYVNNVEKYRNLSRSFNLYRLQADGISAKDLQREFLGCMPHIKELIDSRVKFEGLETQKNTIFNDKSQIKYLDRTKIKEYQDDLKLVIHAISKLKKVDTDIQQLEIKDVLFSLMNQAGLDIHDLTSHVPEILNLDADGLENLLKENNAYLKLNSIKRLVLGLPKFHKEQLRNAKKGIENIILKQEKGIETAIQILKNTDYSLKDYKLLLSQSKKLRHSLDLFDQADRDSLLIFLNETLRVYEVINSYSLQLDSINMLGNRCTTLINDIEVFETMLKINRVKAIKYENEKIVEIINKTVTHNNANIAIKRSFGEYSRFLNGVLTMEDYVKKIPSILAEIKLSMNDFSDVWMNLELPVDVVFSGDKLPEVHKLLKELKELSLYSDTFFSIAEKQTLIMWADATKNLLHYHDVNELDNYIVHHKFIKNLKREFHASSDWLQTILVEPNIDFTEFSSRIVNSLVRTKFQSLPSDKRRIIEANFFRIFARQHREKQKTYYLNGLKDLKSYSVDGAREISNPNNWSSGAKSGMEKIRNNTNIITRTYPIIIATQKEVAKYLAPNKDVFDFVVFDEASQLLPGQALPSIFRSKKAIIIGDPHQMPPSLTVAIGSLLSDEMDDEFETSDSILDLVKNMHLENQYHLKVHYRSESNKLFEPSRASIYAEDGIQPIYEAQLFNAAPIEINDNLGHGLDQTEKFDKNFRNICAKVQEYLAADNDADFCILFTRAEDLHSFKDFLASEENEFEQVNQLYANEKILISTITNCQGIEGTYSILYFRHYDNPGAMWFFKESAGAYKRLNVAITRQRRGLSLILADSREKWLEACERKINNMETAPNTRKSAELLKSLLGNAGEIMDTEYLDRSLSHNSLNFDSPLTEQLYNKLIEYYGGRIGSEVKIYCEVGWHMIIPDQKNIDNNRKNVGFRIDIGVYSIKKKKFILGIEMDGAAYHSGYDKEHSDYNRHEVLKKKGWDLHRIWSTNWLNNESEEFGRLVKKIETNLNGE